MKNSIETKGFKKAVVKEIFSRLHKVLDDLELELTADPAPKEPKTAEDLERMLADAYRKKAKCKFAPWEMNIDNFLDGLDEVIQNYGQERITKAVVHYCNNTILNRKDHAELIISSAKSLNAVLNWVENDIRYKSLS